MTAHTDRPAATDYRGAPLDTYAAARWATVRARLFTDDAGHRWTARPDDLGRLTWTRPDGLGGTYALDGHGAGRNRWTVQHRPAGVTWADAERFAAVGWSGYVDTRTEGAAWAADHQATGGPARGVDAAIGYGLAASTDATEAAAARNPYRYGFPNTTEPDDTTPIVGTEAEPVEDGEPLDGNPNRAPGESTDDTEPCDHPAGMIRGNPHPGTDDAMCAACGATLAEGFTEAAADSAAMRALGMTRAQLHAIDDTARHGSVWACTDCMLYLVNGEPPTDQDDTEHARWSTALRGTLDRLGRLAPFDYDDTDTEPATVAAVARWGSGRRDFDWTPCAVCGSTLGGERHRFSIDRA